MRLSLTRLGAAHLSTPPAMPEAPCPWSTPPKSGDPVPLASRLQPPSDLAWGLQPPTLRGLLPPLGVAAPAAGPDATPTPGGEGEGGEGGPSLRVIFLRLQGRQVLG